LAEIKGFRGLHYNADVVGELSKVVSPPYDVISPQERVYYHHLHPNNFIRLILGAEYESDDERNNRFTRAAEYLDCWCKESVLIQDPEPSIYIYEQRFTRDDQPKVVRGITCAVKLHSYSDLVILPHENTLARPKSQLIHLIRETNANLDSVYGLYADEHGDLVPVFDGAMSRPPDATVRDKDGVSHSMWTVSDPKAIARIADFLADRPVAIADGHHRYETALAYRDEVREKCGCDPEECVHPADYVLMTLVNVYEQDITVFPTHRVVGNLLPEELARLEKYLSLRFDVQETSRETIIAEMAERGAIGVYRRERPITVKPKQDPRTLLHGSEASRKLELNVLHKLILEKSLGIDDEKLRNQTHIFYTRSAEEAMELVDIGQRQVAFLLNNIDVKSVLDIAAAGERMPQKATYFYPKLISGLVLRRLDHE
jgi:uncharacterized protein (DUF1015 family)